MPVDEFAALAKRMETLLPDARIGLPEPLFYQISRMTPLVNVDLLVRDGRGRVLLTWRADEFYGPGWHVPGGIIRFKETAAERIRAVARREFGADVNPEEAPCRVSEILSRQRDVRGHFISLLYRCSLLSKPDENLRYTGDAPSHGMWHWFERCPENLIAVHELYRADIDSMPPRERTAS